jgi:antitoxin StbD
MEFIKSNLTVSITELKANPNKVLAESEGAPVAVLSRNSPKAYFVPADLYHEMLEIIEDQYWNDLIKERKSEASVRVSLDEL